MSKDKKKSIIKRLLLVLVGIALVVSLCVLGINLFVKSSVSDQIVSIDKAKDLKADCVIVLGAGLKPDGNPTLMLEDRVKVGDELYKKGAAPKIIMSGDHGKQSYDEVNAMKKYAMGEGVPSKDIFMDHAGFETYDTMYRARDVFGAKKVIIVSQKYHLYRALYATKKLGLDAYGVSATKRKYDNKQWIRDAREWLARVKIFGKCITKPKPKFLGKKIDLKGSGDVTNDK
ncbi:MAG: YdcF family protein [Eubacterium sp.]|nr:YdcF family protein [Eubacterium sp.]